MQILDSFDCIVVAYAENLILVYRNCFCFNLSGLNLELLRRRQLTAMKFLTRSHIKFKCLTYCFPSKRLFASLNLILVRPLDAHVVV